MYISVNDRRLNENCVKLRYKHCDTAAACTVRYKYLHMICFVHPTKHDLALSGLFRSLEQHDINLLTYLQGGGLV